MLNESDVIDAIFECDRDYSVNSSQGWVRIFDGDDLVGFAHLDQERAEIQAGHDELGDMLDFVGATVSVPGQISC